MDFLNIFILLISLLIPMKLQTIWLNFGSQTDFDDTDINELPMLLDGWIHEMRFFYQVQTVFTGSVAGVIEILFGRDAGNVERYSAVDLANNFYEDLDPGMELIAAYFSSEADHQRILPLEGGVDNVILEYREVMHFPVFANEVLDFMVNLDAWNTTDFTAGLIEWELWLKQTIAPNQWRI